MAFSTGKVDDAGAPPSPPPSSSPPVITPAVIDEGPLSATTTLETWYLEDDSLDGPGRNHLRPLSRRLSGSSFLQTLDRLLLASVQQKRRSTHVVTTSLPLHNALDRSVSGCPTRRVSRSRSSARLSTGPPGSDLELLGRSSLSAIDAYTHSAVTRKRSRSRSLRPRATDYDHGEHSGPSATNKKRKFCEAQPRLSARGFLRRRTANPLIVGLSGAFKLCYAKGPGSLRRAESLRVELPTNAPEEEEVLNEVIEHYRSPLCVSKYPGLSKVFFPQELPIIVGSVASPYAANAPTEPTTPTSNDHPSPGHAGCLTLANLPIIAPPAFELIQRAPLSREAAAERRIVVLLEREKDDRDVERLRAPPSCTLPRTEDEEELFWMGTPDPPSDEYDSEMEGTRHATPAHNGPQRSNFNRALIYHSPLELSVDSRVLEEVMDWFLEVTPPEDDHTTSYTPGDLFDLLSTSTETRFHAGHLFMRYFHLVSCVDEDEELEALEAVTWDLAVACLALSVKFHRDVLFPLDVIYAQEFLELAPHAMEFADLENAQRDVLEALSYRIGSATPGAFMEELSEALPALRKLVGFDGGWDGVQKKAWDILCDALQQQDLLRFPLSVLTAAAIMEGVLDVLIKRYKSTGTDGRGKPCKRDSGSSRKAAVKCSRGARLDVQEVLQISDEELFACQKWLGVYVESK